MRVDYIDLSEDDHLDMEQVENMTLQYLSIFGFLHTDDGDVVKVIKEWDSREECMQAMVIPRCCVLNVVELTEVKE